MPYLPIALLQFSLLKAFYKLHFATLQSPLTSILSRYTRPIVQLDNTLQHSTPLVLFLQTFVLSQIGDCLFFSRALSQVLRFLILILDRSTKPVFSIISQVGFDSCGINCSIRLLYYLLTFHFSAFFYLNYLSLIKSFVELYY